MIKLSLAKKFGIELVAGDMVASSDKPGSAAMISRTAATYFNGVGAEDYRRVESFATRLISDGIPASIDGDVLLEITNGNGLVLYISARNVAWQSWATWSPSMEWLVQQAADKPVAYKDDTQHFGEDVLVDLHNVTYVPEGFVSRCVVMPVSIEPFQDGCGVGYKLPLESTASPESAKPIFTQAMSDAGEWPPVGAECIVMPDGYKAVITYIGNGVGCFICLDDGNECGFTHRDTSFKPLDTRTEKEKAVDAALSLDEYRDGLGMMSRKDFIAKLYDAGLLK